MCGRFEQSGTRRYYARSLGVDTSNEREWAGGDHFASYNIAPGLCPWMIALNKGEIQFISQPWGYRTPQMFKELSPDLVIIGSSLDTLDELEVAEQIRRLDRKTPLILITRHGSEELAIAALRLGINDYFKLPFSFKKELVASVSRNLSRFPQQPLLSHTTNIANLVGESARIQEIKSYIPRVALSDCNVLITGETGTGKELIAELIHTGSPRRSKPFICINCAAVPENLLESELFGYEKGAFTGAHSSYEGKLNLAGGGTVFLDEIGEMSPCAQAKVLRVIESKETYRLGGKKSVPLNVRVIAATNQDLESLILEKKFRKDLYFRLNIARIHLPSLRDRREDISLLFNHYLRKWNNRLGLKVDGFTEEVLAYLLRYDWPGNVRELKNLLEAIFVNRPSQKISLMDLPEQFRRRFSSAEGFSQEERDVLLSALSATNWNKSKAAKKLQWSRMTLYRKMLKHDIHESN